MILVDTDVVSFLLKGDSRAERYFEAIRGDQPVVSFMTAAELLAWAELRHWGARRRAELDRLLRQRYGVLGVDLGLAHEWARIQAEGALLGQRVSVQDGWVAATARYFDIRLVTHNVRHFEGIRGLRLGTGPA